jgi:hypothetical protein
MRFLQTSQKEFPLVLKAQKRDVSFRAILHRGEFPGAHDPE